jgi:methionyl-tRNA formyltransferase
MADLRILFLGQKKLGEICFERLLEKQGHRFEVCAAISNEHPEVWWKSNLIKQKCTSTGIPFESNLKRNNRWIIRMIDQYNINCILSVQHSWIIPVEILKKVENAAFNVHNAKLPDYRGYNACNHEILNGETVHTTTIHRMAEQVDMGDVIVEETIEIERGETARSLYKKSLKTGEKAFIKLLEYLESGQPLPCKPVTGEGRYYRRDSLDKCREIEKMSDTDEVDRKCRAMFFPPFEPAYYVKSGKKYYVLPEDFREYAQEYGTCVE